MNHLLSILILPFTVTIIVPAIILSVSKSIAIGWGVSAPLNLPRWIPRVKARKG